MHNPSNPAVAAAAALILVLASGAKPSEVPPDAGVLLAHVQSWLDGTRDLAGRFEQSLISGALGAGLEESGRVYLERPGRMRWDYLDPEIKVALVEGERTRLYLAEDEQLWEGRLADADSLLAVLLAGDRPLSEVFRAAVAEGDVGRRWWTLRLQPLGDDESFQEVSLRVRPARFELEELDVLDAAGNRLRYRFSELRRNRGLPEDAFVFEPPPGTEVVRTGASAVEEP